MFLGTGAVLFVHYYVGKAIHHLDPSLQLIQDGSSLPLAEEKWASERILLRPAPSTHASGADAAEGRPARRLHGRLGVVGEGRPLQAMPPSPAPVPPCCFVLLRGGPAPHLDSELL